MGAELLAGPLVAPVIADDCFWEIIEGGLVLTFAKQDQAKACGRENAEGWWPGVLASDEPRDVTLCDKEPFLLGEMDDLKHGSMRCARACSRWRHSRLPSAGRPASSVARARPFVTPSRRTLTRRYHVAKMLGMDDASPMDGSEPPQAE